MKKGFFAGLILSGMFCMEMQAFSLSPLGSGSARQKEVVKGKVVARALNPISPPGLYIADPEVRQMPDGRIYYYVYSGH